eukprot:2333797-Heterocapsa_arctica.AAC.1
MDDEDERPHGIVLWLEGEPVLQQVVRHHILVEGEVGTVCVRRVRPPQTADGQTGSDQTKDPERRHH